MQIEKNLKEKSEKIVQRCAEEGLTLGESVRCLEMAIEIMRDAARLLTQKKSNTALKKVLKAANDYSDGKKSPE